MSNQHKSLIKRLLQATEDPEEFYLWDEDEGYYLEVYELSTDDISGLLEIAKQWANPDWLDSLDPEIKEARYATWLPVIAWRCLADLKAPQAIEPLVKILCEDEDEDEDEDKSRLSLDLPEFLIGFGGDAIVPLQRLLEDTLQPTFKRLIVGDIICEIAHKHPETRSTVVELLRQLLKTAETTEIELNSFTVSHLLDLNATEAAEEIERAFSNNRIDVGFTGQWEEVRKELKIDGLGLPMPDDPICEEYDVDDFEEDQENEDEWEEKDEEYDHETFVAELADELNDAIIETWLDDFLDSPECQEVIAKLGGINWSHAFFDYFSNYSDKSIESLDSGEVSSFLLSYCPRKVSIDPEQAEEIVFELIKFFEFVDREIKFKHAKEILTTLNDAELVKELKQELSDPRNYGMAKSFFMGGKAAGFDMTTQESMDSFLAFYNQNRLQQIAAERIDESHEETGPRPPIAPIRVEKVGRNDPCPCGSGKKHKKCCLRGGVI